eukprot:UN01967
MEIVVQNVLIRVGVTDMSDPCACVEGCGFSSSDGTCKSGSDTHCYECKTLDGCTDGDCDGNCEGTYDPMTTCQCTPDCAEYKNCCVDCGECYDHGECEGDSFCNMDSWTCESCENVTCGESGLTEDEAHCCDPCRSVTDMSDPCACVEGCGFSSSDGTCKAGSDTHCYECTTLDGCMPGECGESCTADYNPMTTCQCTPDCEEYRKLLSRMS